MNIPVKGKYGMPTLGWLEDYITNDETTCIDFLVNGKIVVKPECCPSCGGNLLLRSDSIYLFRYGTRRCRRTVSIFENSIFFKSRIPCNEIMRIAYHWLCGDTWKSIVIKTGMSDHTITNWINCFKHLIIWDMDE
jgi:hypothetical protein